MERDDIFVIFTGTGTRQRGGIGHALLGYFEAIQSVGISYVFVPTHHATARGGKWKFWLYAFMQIPKHILQNHKKKIVVYGHSGPGLSLCRQSILLGFCRLLGTTTVVQLHSIKFDTYLNHSWKKYLFRLAVFPFSGIAVLTPWWHKRLSDEGVAGNLFVISNPLPKEWEQKALLGYQRAVPQKKITVLTMTRIEAGKGVDLLIQSMPLLPDNIHLIVAGDGNQLRMLKRLVKRIGVKDRVLFTGWVMGDEKQQLLDEADIFCLPSSYDSFGMVYLEAMANGLPVVALGRGPIKDVIVNNHTGILIKKAEEQLVADAILKMLNEKSRKQMGKQAQRWVLEQFSSEVIGGNILKMIDSLTCK